jgi:hypothetical protein
MADDHGDIEEGGPVLVLGTLREVLPDRGNGAHAVVEFPESGPFDHNVVAVPLDTLRAARGTQS